MEALSSANIISKIFQTCQQRPSNFFTSTCVPRTPKSNRKRTKKWVRQCYNALCCDASCVQMNSQPQTMSGPSISRLIKRFPHVSGQSSEPMGFCIIRLYQIRPNLRNFCQKNSIFWYKKYFMKILEVSWSWPLCLNKY